MAQRIAITGSTGLIGLALCDWFKKRGDAVSPVIRNAASHAKPTNAILWDIDARKIEADKLEGLDAVIHLAGASIAGRRWNKQYKETIRDTRINTTSLLAQALAQLKKPPRVLICASAIGYYGNQDTDAPIDESAPAGQGFLPDVCRLWEQAAQPAQKRGIRIAYARFGVVLSPKGGALGKMLPIFKCGLGGPVGSGEQIMSWISLDEVPQIVSHLIDHQISGPVNCVSPLAVSNKEFTRILGQVLHLPAIFPVPALGIKILFGEMGQDLLLGGAHIVPKRLFESGYVFKHPDLKTALENILKESK